MFTCYIPLYAIRDCTASTAAKHLIDYFLRFGIPKSLLSDQDPAYESALFQELMRELGVCKLRTPSRVIPNIRGVFLITLINVDKTAVQLNNCKRLGVLLTSNETICTADSVEGDNASHIANNITHGDLSEGNRASLLSLISKCQSIFAANPKKPTLVKN